MTKELLYYPCIEDNRTGVVDKIVGPLMSKDDASDYLKRQYYSQWINHAAMPQPQDYVEKNYRIVGRGDSLPSRFSGQFTHREAYELACEWNRTHDTTRMAVVEPIGENK